MTRITNVPVLAIGALVLGTALAGCSAHAPSPLSSEAPITTGAPSPSASPIQSVQPTSSPTPVAEPGVDGAGTVTRPTGLANWIVSATGIGPVTMGMTVGEVSALRDPKLLVTDDAESDGLCLSGYASWGDTTIIAGGLRAGDTRVGYITIDGVSGPHTAQGIGTASTLQEALAAYPAAVYYPDNGDSTESVRVKTDGVWIVFDSFGDHGKSDKIDGFTIGLKDGHPQGACPLG